MGSTSPSVERGNPALAFVSAVLQAFRPLQTSGSISFLLPAVFGVSLALSDLSCGGASTSTGTNGSGGTSPASGNFWSAGTTNSVASSPSSLVMTCDNICNNVLAGCVNPPLSQNAYARCLDACQYLDLVQSNCAADFAAYLACLAGADSVSCSADGQYIVVTASACDSQRAAYAECTGGPPLAACIDISQESSACISHAPRARALLCVGVPPSDCDAVGGLLGPYCCP